MMRLLIILLLLFSVNSIYAACNVDVLPSTPTVQFINNQDGTVTDTTTGLMWQRCHSSTSYNDGGTPTDMSDDSCDPAAGNRFQNWQEALQSANASTYASYNDWRLPNIKELHSIVEVACSQPAINQTIFQYYGTNLDNMRFWASTPSNRLNTNLNTYREAWVVSFQKGAVLERLKIASGAPDRSIVRMVRGGQ